MKPNEIRAEMLLKNIRSIDMARKIKVSRSAISRVIYGNLASPRIRVAIAEMLGKKVEEIWPVREG